MNVQELGPLHDMLIVDDDVRLREESGKTVRDVELLGALLGVVCAPGTPAVKQRAVPVKITDVLDDGGDRDALAANTANERIVNVDVNAKLAAHGTGCA